MWASTGAPYHPSTLLLPGGRLSGWIGRVLCNELIVVEHVDAKLRARLRRAPLRAAAGRSIMDCFGATPLAMTTASLRPPARLSVVAPYGPWFGRPAKTPVLAHPEPLQGYFDLNEKYFSSGSYFGGATTNKVAPPPWLIWASACLVNGQNRVTFCERLRRSVYKTRRKTRFAPQKTRFKKALIILFIA